MSNTPLTPFSDAAIQTTLSGLTMTAATTQDFAIKWAIGADEVNYVKWSEQVKNTSTYIVTD